MSKTYEFSEAEAHSDVSLDDAQLEWYQIRGLPFIDKDSKNLAKVSHEAEFFWKRKKEHIDLNSVATQPSVYDVDELRNLFWPRDDYENIHRFDPDLRWTWKEEFRVVRKLDYRILLWACIMLFSFHLDRSNLGQANSDNFLKNVGMTTDDFNNGKTIGVCTFLAAELPSQLISKRIGPERWIPIQIVSWSIVALCQAFITGRTSFYITRFLLGILQGGFVPAMVLYLSYFYTSKELTLRSAIFWAASNVASIIAAFLGFGILHLKGKDHTVLGGDIYMKQGWRWLFIIEGLLTLCIGLLSFGLMPSAPTTTASWFRGKRGWFTEREESILVTRLMRDDPAKGTMHNRQGMRARDLLKSIMEYHLWIIYLIGICWPIMSDTVGSYLTLNLRAIGFGTFETNLLTIPAYVIGIISLVVGTYISEYCNSPTLVSMTSQIWTLPLIISLCVFTKETNRWSKFVVSTLIVGCFAPHAIQVSWCSRNSNGVRTRAVSASLYSMALQIGQIISSQIYRTSDSPLYHKGNWALFGINVFTLILFIVAFFYYRMLNRQRDLKWRSMTPAEQEYYQRNTKDEGSKRLDFKFTY